MATQPNNFLTPEQYLEIERKAEFKSEYVDGQMFAMAGASFRHNIRCELDWRAATGAPAAGLPDSPKRHAGARKRHWPVYLSRCYRHPR